MTKEESIIFENVLDTIANHEDVTVTHLNKDIIELNYGNATTTINTNGYSFLYLLSLLVNGDVSKALLK